MSPEQVVEATLFASQTPLTPAELARADESLTEERVEEALRVLRDRYEEERHAFQIYRLGDGYQILTRPEYAPYLERFDSVPRSPVLSSAALETLAIVAYRQPIGRIEIEEIRGVDSSSVLRTLQDWELIDVVGRGEGLGRPLLYGTTTRFLDHFGFTDLADLPRPEDLPVALRSSEERWTAAPDEEERVHPSDRTENGRRTAPDASPEADGRADAGNRAEVVDRGNAGNRAEPAERPSRSEPA